MARPGVSRGSPRPTSPWLAPSEHRRRAFMRQATTSHQRICAESTRKQAPDETLGNHGLAARVYPCAGADDAGQVSTRTSATSRR
jgi:hypothetical protein